MGALAEEWNVRSKRKMDTFIYDFPPSTILFLNFILGGGMLCIDILYFYLWLDVQADILWQSGIWG
jgi:hypothetical protein